MPGVPLLGMPSLLPWLSCWAQGLFLVKVKIGKSGMGWYFGHDQRFFHLPTTLPSGCSIH